MTAKDMLGMTSAGGFWIVVNRHKELPPKEDQESVSEFVAKLDCYEGRELATKVFNNRQRTSTRNGMLKAEAVLEFARALKKHDVEYLQNIDENVVFNESLEKDIKEIKGQSSGISLRYFFMLTGHNGLIKPDRMIMRSWTTHLIENE